MAGTIMIVEDEPAVARGVQVALEREGYATAIIGTGEEAIARFADIAPDLVLLDVRMPGIDGFEVCRQLRRETRAPVLFLTARADEVDKVVGLEIGADDYLVKPFSVRELVSRIRGAAAPGLRRTGRYQTGRTLRRGDLVIDLERRRVTRGGERITLTTTEFDLLRHMATKPGRVYTRLQLLELVRDYEALEADERTINVHISHIRDKSATPPTALHQDGPRRGLCLQRGLSRLCPTRCAAGWAGSRSSTRGWSCRWPAWHWWPCWYRG
jgi:DNA-binding response OmpR family regulator